MSVDPSPRASRANVMDRRDTDAVVACDYSRRSGVGANRLHGFDGQRGHGADSVSLDLGRSVFLFQSLLSFTVQALAPLSIPSATEPTDVSARARRRVVFAQCAVNVLLMRDRLQVARSTTKGRLAEMVDVESFGNRSNKMFVRNAMRKQHDFRGTLSPQSDVECSVPSAVRSPRPQPTTVAPDGDSGQNPSPPCGESGFGAGVRNQSRHALNHTQNNVMMEGTSHGLSG